VIVSFSPAAAAPGEGSAVEVRSSKRVFPHTIEHLTVSGSDAVISFAGVRTIGEALRLVGCSLWAEGPALKALAEGTSEAADNPAAGVLGFRVFDLQGECWGTVKAHPHFSLSQVLEIEDSATGGTVYVPWHKSLVVKIDRRSRRIVIDPPAGLRELNK
jgi:ribosomal 30S subunit maturation factor RimM